MHFTKDPGDLYSAPATTPGGSMGDQIPLLESDCQVVYDIYDKLTAENPNCIKKTVMGQVFGKDFCRYTFTPDNPDAIKVAIVSSMHGYEQGCGWTAAQFFRLMYENREDPHLKFLRENIIFDVIPVANPWGFSNNKRCNGNGVDLNRNFEPDFVYDMDPASKYWGGSAPCSEDETKMLMAFTEENADAALVLDYHNIGKGSPLFYVYSEQDVAFAEKVFVPLAEKWRAQFPQLTNEDQLWRTLPNGGEGMFADYLKTKGLWVITMETPWTMPVLGQEKYDAPTIRCAVDVLANTLLILLRNM